MRHDDSFPSFDNDEARGSWLVYPFAKMLNGEIERIDPEDGHVNLLVNVMPETQAIAQVID